jgi:hypothetical protein
MNMRLLNQKGFSVLEVSLILIIISMIGGTGYYVFQSRQKTNDNLSSTPSQVEQKSAPIETSTAGWQLAKSSAGQFSVKYPKGWVQPSNRDLCDADVLARGIYVGPTSEDVLKCATENFGQIGITSTEGDHQIDSDFSQDPGFASVQQKVVTVDGVKGKRVQGIAGASPGGEGDFSQQAQFSGSYADGTLVVKYIFYANNNTYVASYQQSKTGLHSQDVLSIFDTMVTKTLKFE